MMKIEVVDLEEDPPKIAVCVVMVEHEDGGTFAGFINEIFRSELKGTIVGTTRVVRSGKQTGYSGSMVKVTGRMGGMTKIGGVGANAGCGGTIDGSGLRISILCPRYWWPWCRR